MINFEYIYVQENMNLATVYSHSNKLQQHLRFMQSRCI